MGYYGIGIATDDLTGSLYRDFAIMRGIEIPSYLAGIYLANHYGRKKTTCGSLLVASLFCLPIGCVPTSGDIMIVRLILGVAGNFCISIAFALFITWTMELYGTDQRANVVAVSNFMSRGGGAVAPWIIKGFKDLDPKAPFILTGGMGILSVTFMFWILPETKDTPMKYTSKKDDTFAGVRRL